MTDYFTSEGDYIRSSIKYEEFRKSTDYLDTKEETRSEPSTILDVDIEGIDSMKARELTEDEKALVKEHVLKVIDTLD